MIPIFDVGLTPLRLEPAPRDRDPMLDMGCPICGACLVTLVGRYGPFTGCLSWPVCTYKDVRR